MRNNTVDPKRNEPLYHQVKDILISRIENRHWIPGTIIPTEQELMDEFHVSRTTIREAISILVNTGLLERKQGKGTIVKAKQLTGTLGRLRGFAEEVMEKGLVPHSKLLRAEFSEKLFHEKSMLDVPEEEEILVIERVRLANDIPIAIERSCWPNRIGKILMEYDLNTAKYYEILEKNNVNLKQANEKIIAINATIQEADLLGIRAGEALLEMSRLSFGIDDRPMEYTRTKYRSDQYSYSIELKR